MPRKKRHFFILHTAAMLTSKDLLYKALDYDGFWNTSKKMKDANPSQCRQEQLEKLFAAFAISKKNAKPNKTVQIINGKEVTVVSFYAVSGVSKSMNRTQYLKRLTDFSYFSSGEFIGDADSNRYLPVSEQIIAAAKTIFPEQTGFINSNPPNLMRLFSNLYNFRLTVYAMTKYNFGQKTMRDFSTEDDYALHVRKKFIDSLQDNLQETDDLLCILIDPEKKTFKEEEIGYSDYNFTILDAEWQFALHTQF